MCVKSVASAALRVGLSLFKEEAGVAAALSGLAVATIFDLWLTAGILTNQFAFRLGTVGLGAFPVTNRLVTQGIALWLRGLNTLNRMN